MDETVKTLVLSVGSLSKKATQMLLWVTVLVNNWRVCLKLYLVICHTDSTLRADGASQRNAWTARSPSSPAPTAASATRRPLTLPREAPT